MLRSGGGDPSHLTDLVRKEGNRMPCLRDDAVGPIPICAPLDSQRTVCFSPSKTDSGVASRAGTLSGWRQMGGTKAQL